MARFPALSSLIVEATVGKGLSFQTLKSPFGPMGRERRKATRLFPLRNYTVKSGDPGVLLAHADTLCEFYKARKGSFEAFNFFEYDAGTYTGEYVGTYDGTSLVFNLPSEDGASYKLYVDGSEQTAGVNYTFGAGTGEDGADKATFVSLAVGAIITYDFTGHLKTVCTFAEDNLNIEIIRNRLATFGIQLIGELNA